MKNGSIVKLTNKARKDFYETDKLIECFEFGGDFRTSDFISFVDEYVGLINKDTGIGFVSDIKTDQDGTVVKVEFKGPSGRVDWSWFNTEDLKVVV